MGYTEAQKKAIYKYRETHKEIHQKAIYKYRASHKDAYNEYMLELNMKRYEENKDEMNRRRNELAQYRKDNNYEYMSKVFRKILL